MIVDLDCFEHSHFPGTVDRGISASFSALLDLHAGIPSAFHYFCSLFVKRFGLPLILESFPPAGGRYTLI